MARWDGEERKGVVESVEGPVGACKVSNCTLSGEKESILRSQDEPECKGVNASGRVSVEVRGEGGEERRKAGEWRVIVQRKVEGKRKREEEKKVREGEIAAPNRTRGKVKE